MYFPAVLAPKTVLVRTVVWPHEKGTCIVFRDNFPEDTRIEKMIDHILLTTPSAGSIQEMQIKTSEVDYV